MIEKRETKTKLQKLGAGAVATALFLSTTTGCTPRFPNPGPKAQETEYSEVSEETTTEQELCSCCDYSNGGYTYHSEFDPQKPRIEAGTDLSNGIFKPDSHHWKNLDGVSIFVGKKGIEAQEEGVFWKMRCNDEMPQILMGEKEYWEFIVVLKETLDKREKEQLENGELGFMNEKLIVLSLEDLKDLDEKIDSQD